MPATSPAPPAPDVRSAAADPDAREIGGATPDKVRAAAATMARELPAGRSVVGVAGLDTPRLQAAVEGLLLGCYHFSLAHDVAPTPSSFDLAGADDIDGAEAAIARGVVAATATRWARTLANTRSNIKTPAWLGRQAVDGLTAAGVAVTVRDDAWLAEHGFGGMLAVGGGSASPPRLIEATWTPRGARQGVHVVLVGKGITFDSGGLNRKVGAGMNTMYTDMAGGAAVLGALQAIAGDEVPVHVTALVPAAENMMSGGSYRPGDVVRHHGGRTSEIGNTDAEGRMVLADAIAYAVASLQPTVIVDVATLTGAAKMALGLRTGGLFATSDPLADALLVAGRATGEPLWRLPMPAEYEGLLNSPIADATNSAGNPGAVTAAFFLKPFARDTPWAHLDIAGPARAGEDDGILTQGATGFGARLLHAWVASLA